MVAIVPLGYICKNIIAKIGLEYKFFLMSIKIKHTIIAACALFFLALVLLCSFVLIKASDKIPVEPITALLEEHTGNINSGGRWDNLDDKNWTYSIIEVEPGSELSFKCYGQFFIAFLTSYEKPVKGGKPTFVSTKDFSERLTFRAGVHTLVVPDGAKYLYFSRLTRGSDSTPRYLYVDYENVLEGNYPDVVQNVFEDYPADKQQVCIHHDSFCREISGKKWHIGSNGGEVFTMNYISPRQDYQTVDDGFRINEGFLTKDSNVTVKEAFRLIERKLSEESLIEVGLPTINKSVERIIFNFKDDESFDSYLITRNKKRITVAFVSRINGKENKTRILRKKLKGNALRFFLSNNGTLIYLDSQQIASVKYKLNASLKCGLMIDKDHQYSYDFFNVFNLKPYKVYDEARFTDNGTGKTHAGLTQGMVQDYSYRLDTEKAHLSPYAERFELHRNTITDYKNDRVEKSFNYQLQTNLRKIKIDFDVLIPADNSKDESFDCIMQIHDRTDDETLSRSPYIAIRVQNNKFVLTSQSIEKPAKSGFNVNKIQPIADCKLGKWTHFSIYIKEGYLPEHNPVTRIEIDDKLAFESNDPNCNNNPRGGYIRYGIYKADWLKGIGDTRIQKKIIYFDNFIVRM